MSSDAPIPNRHYGVLERTKSASVLDVVVEQVVSLGYAVLDSEYSPDNIAQISQAFDVAHARYVKVHGEAELKSIDELNTLRALLTWGDPVFARLALNPLLMSALEMLIHGKFMLNQQNGIINPPGAAYNQGAWHRDFPYQHFVSSRPLAINALFCVDDFTLENGATYVLPASHKSGPFASEAFVERNAVQVAAKAGSFILLDCMLFHTGGFNRTNRPRRAVNHVYSIPYFKQQINIPMNLGTADLPNQAKDVFGFSFQEPGSVATYLAQRKGKLE